MSPEVFWSAMIMIKFYATTISLSGPYIFYSKLIASLIAAILDVNPDVFLLTRIASSFMTYDRLI